MRPLTIVNRLRRAFGYDGAETNGRRRPPPANTQSEDGQLTPSKRKKAISHARDIPRNFAIAGWMIRKHLDFVSSFSFNCTTGNKDFNATVEAFWKKYSKKENCHAAKRHPLRRIGRMAEARRTIDGDIILLKRQTGRLQAIEADRIKKPAGITCPANADPVAFKHGVITNKAGAAEAYAIHTRTPGGSFKFERLVKARDCFFHAYYATHRFDQTRGIGPIISALAPLTDVYEGLTFALAKIKVAQLFGLVTTRDADSDLNPGPTPQLGTGETTDGSTSTDENDENTRYQVDLGAGPFKLELYPGDDAKFLGENTPSAEFQSFTQVVTGICLKALDLPYSFYDESFTNFFGSRAALLLYQKSARDKIADNHDLLLDIATWRFALAVARGELLMPPGMTFDELAANLVFTPDGIPWWNPAQEVTAATKAVEGAFETRTEIRRRTHGDDWRENVAEKLAEENTILAELGVQIGKPVPQGPNPNQRPEDIDRP